ncbi:MAG: hypothetical protein FJ100_09265 [Deltaproteobacteria bacterium]|nr:hypothetical protein [Deltaproteobacteria bacterium]
MFFRLPVAFAFAAALLCPTVALAWDEVTDDDGVKVYRRAKSGSDVKEFKAVGVIAAHVDTVMAVIADVEKYPRTLPPTQAVKALSPAGKVAKHHFLINPPVISRRDYCAITTSSRAGTGYRVDWKQTDEGCPPTDGVVRMAANVGSWSLSPGAEPNTTQVQYQVHADPGGSLPTFMVNRATTKTMLEVFESLRKATKLGQYAKCAGNIGACVGWL